jgi:hypothetical protein
MRAGTSETELANFRATCREAGLELRATTVGVLVWY